MKRSKFTAFRPMQYLLVLGGLLFLWPALVNGGPFYFNDTTAYVRGVDAAVFHTTGMSSEWTGIAKQTAPTTPKPGATVAAHAPALAIKPVLLGRSAYYGMILYLGVLLGSFWVVIALQALIAAFTGIVLLRHFVDSADQRRFAVAAVAMFLILAVTPLPFFVCLLMPDLFSGLVIVAAAAILLGWDREPAPFRCYLVAVLALSALVHSSNVLLIIALGIVMILWRLPGIWRRRDTIGNLVPAGVLLACAVIGLGGETAFSLAITKITGQAPIRPPFLTARFVDDGPGTAYLRQNCGHSDLVLCDYVGRLPAASDGFLWDANARTGVFNAVSPDKQRLLATEQMPFVLASVKYAPVATATMLLRDFGQQIGKTKLGEFNYSDEQRHYFLRKLPDATRAAVQKSRAYRDENVIAPFELIAVVLTIGALGVLVWSWRRRSRIAPWAGYASVAVGGVLINDIICGCLSTPHDRYQMRVIWVLPMVAALVLFAQRSAGPTSQPAN